MGVKIPEVLRSRIDVLRRRSRVNEVDRSYCSNQNTWSENHPQCIVVHNTDNFAAGADAARMQERSTREIFRLCRRIIT